MNSMSFDTLSAAIVIIGSGPGGSVTAALLAEAGRDVLILEEGPHLSLKSCMSFSTIEMEQKYRNGGMTPAFGKPKVAYVEGCCVGGGSEINSGLYHRTPPDILDRWKTEFGLKEAALENLLPHFEINEAELSVQTMPPPLPPASLRLHEGALSLRWKSLEVPRWFAYSSDAPSGDGEKGTRKSMTESFLPRALKAGARLRANCRATRLVRDTSGGITIHCQERFENEWREITISARHVFVSGGAIQTPALLRRSGLRKNIGNSLQMHSTVKILARFPDTVNTSGMGVPVHQVKEFSPRISLGCSISSRPYIALALLDHPPYAEAVEEWPRMAIYYAMITPEARGTVRALPGFRDALVKFPLTKVDLRNLSDGMRKLAECLFAAGADTLYPSVSGLGPFRSSSDLSQIPASLPRNRANVMTIHLSSSCPMGENREICAVDSFGRIHDENNLHIADASLLSTAPSVNPQGSIMAFARRNALRFLEENK